MKPLVMIALLAGSVSAQDSGLKARELFYTPPPDASQAQTPKQSSTQTTSTQTTAIKRNVPARRPITKETAQNVVAVANVPLGLRYSVLKRDPAGKFEQVDSDSLFHSGDRIRLTVDTNTTGYLYVVMQGSSGNWRLLFPSADVDGGSNRIEKGQTQQIPAGDKGQFLFDEQAGTEKLFLVLSRKPEADLDKLIYSITGGGNQGSERMLMAKATVGNDVVNRLRDEVKSRDLVFEKVDEIKLDMNDNGAEKTEKATYVVNPSRGEDARLVVDVSLKHNK